MANTESTPAIIDPRHVRNDVDMILWSLRLQGIRRFVGQRFWEEETGRAERADREEPAPRLESVAEHSWHVADVALLLSSHFPELDGPRCVCLAVLHDKMEILTGDHDPVGKSGTGEDTHAFSVAAKATKDAGEEAAIENYLSRLHPPASDVHRAYLHELLAGTSPESRFVKAVDKLQALAFVHVKKAGTFEDHHLRFTLRYSRKSVEYFPKLGAHYDELADRLLRSVAENRRTSVPLLVRRLEPVEAVAESRGSIGRVSL